MKVLFVAGFGPIVPDDRLAEAAELYSDALGLSFQRTGEYLHTEDIEGVKHFALWPLSQAAESCFGESRWPEDIPAPQGWLEFDVDDMHDATEELKGRGYRLLVANRMEAWGQAVTRFLSPEGLLVGLAHTPWLREEGPEN